MTASMRPRPEGRGEPEQAGGIRAAFRTRFNAATTRRPWRTADGRRTRGNAIVEASMRPRPEGRGEPRSATEWRHVPWASMRPRPEGRGERAACSRGKLQRPSFNAATTRRPWRTGAVKSRRTSPVLQCGHDPKAVENGRCPAGCQAAGQLQCGHDPKAVENRFIVAIATSAKHGFNAATTRRPWRTRAASATGGASRLLQCGHDPKAVENCRTRHSRPATAGFNAATTRRPWRTADHSVRGRRCRRLQCGHDPKAVENHALCETASEIQLASMRPRPEGRGERQHADRRRMTVGRASMRPRPEGRGERSCAWHRQRAFDGLQCGHDPKAVENHARPSSSCRCGQLQCGHDPKAVENPTPRTIHGRDRRFNAATTRRPWRTQAIAAIGRRHGELQCGHDPKAVENRSNGTSSRCGKPSFNAATTRRPWRTQWRTMHRRSAMAASFNAATTRRPWRT